MVADNYRQAFKSAIARIYHSNGAVVGAGFLVAERHLLTCAHVVTAALGISITTTDAPTNSIELHFPLIALGHKVRAKVVFWQPVNEGQVGEDIAGLELEGSPPNGCQPVRLVSTSEFWHHRFQVFGFPSQRDMGIWASGELRDQIGSSGWVQMEDIKAPGYAVEPGFSGAPVWDEELKGVVGMAVAAERKREEAKAAFMLPTSILCSAWSDLAEWVADSQQQASTSDASKSFLEIKLEARREYWSVQVEKYKAACNQLGYTLAQTDAIAIREQVETLDREITQLEQEIKELTSS